MKNIIIAFILIFFSGCASSIKSHLGKVSNKNHKILILDKRSPENKVYYRKSFTTPIQKLGDKNFEPNIIEYIKYRISLKTNNDKKYTIVLNELNIFDIFIARVRGAQSAALSAVVGGVINDFSGMENSDFILVSMSGKINGKPFKSQSSVAYEASDLSLNVFNDKNFKLSLKNAIDSNIDQILQSNIPKI